MHSALRRAFTLVELLVVIAVIGILAGALGMALSAGDRGPALQAAQSALSGLVASARAQAALDTTNATLVIWADRTDPDTYLRRAAIVTRVNNDTAYAIQGDVVDLPRGIFFVPGDAGATLPAKQETPADWTNLTLTESQNTNDAPTQATSSGKSFKRYDEASTPVWQDDPRAPATYYESIAFDPYGALANSTVNYLAIAPGELQVGPNASDKGVLFQSPDGLRGLKLTTYGLPIVLNEKLAFK